MQDFKRGWLYKNNSKQTYATKCITYSFSAIFFIYWMIQILAILGLLVYAKLMRNFFYLFWLHLFSGRLSMCNVLLYMQKFLFECARSSSIFFLFIIMLNKINSLMFRVIFINVSFKLAHYQKIISLFLSIYKGNFAEIPWWIRSTSCSKGLTRGKVRSKFTASYVTFQIWLSERQKNSHSGQCDT